MGYSLRTLQWLVRLHRDGALGAGRSVVELGSQDIMADPITAAALLADACAFRCDEGTLLTPQVLFAHLGYTEYACIDTDGRHGALCMDLNNDFAATYGLDRAFDLVTNAGTTEHVFDQAQALANMHRLCAPGGVMVHIVPTQGWPNHGYYGYEPGLFVDLAAANGYEVLAFDLDVGVGAEPGWVQPYQHGVTDAASIAATHGADVMLLLAMRKASDADFRLPFDSHYLEVNKVADAYAGQERSEGVLSLHHDDVFQPWSAHRDIALMSGRQLVGEVLRRLTSKLTRRRRQP